MELPPPTPLTSLKTLAERVRFLRHQLDLSPKQLAQKALVSVDLVEDIESGLMLFMAPSTRQKLARALRVNPLTLSEVEKRPKSLKGSSKNAEGSTPSVTEENAVVDQQTILLRRIMDAPRETYACPSCGNFLRVQLFERRDLHDRPLMAIKVTCRQCLFRMTQD